MISLLALAGFACLVCLVLCLVWLAGDGNESSAATRGWWPSVGSSLAPPPGSIVGEKLSDFKYTESRVYPPGAAPEIQNFEQVGPGHFRMTLRHRGSWHDGDRGLTSDKYKDKSRAELSSLKGNDRPFTVGSTWLMGTTVRLAPDFRPSRGYCNLMQPCAHQSFVTLTGLAGDTVTGSLNVFQNGLGTPFRAVRAFKMRRGEWVTLVVRISIGKSGSYALSVNGDSFRGIADIDTTKSGERTPPLGGTWGLYGSATYDTAGKPLGDQVVEHKNIFLKKLS